jgi:hypothetical protein
MQIAESDQNQKNLGKTCKNLGKPKNKKKLGKTKKKIRESWLGPPLQRV